MAPPRFRTTEGLSIEGLDEMLKRTDADYLIKPPARTFMADAGSALHQAARSITPIGKTGKLIQSYKVLFGSGDPPAWVQLTNTQPYFRFVALGTKAHRIVPRTKKALFWPGAAHPVKSVMHPGTKANPILARAQAMAETEIQGPIARAFDKDVEARWNAS